MATGAATWTVPRCCGLLEMRIFIPLSEVISIESTVDSSIMSISFFTYRKSIIGLVRWSARSALIRARSAHGQNASGWSGRRDRDARRPQFALHPSPAGRSLVRLSPPPLRQVLRRRFSQGGAPRELPAPNHGRGCDRTNPLARPAECSLGPGRRHLDPTFRPEPPPQPADWELTPPHRIAA